MSLSSLNNRYAGTHALFILGVSLSLSGLVFAILSDLGYLSFAFEPIGITALGVMMLIGWAFLNNGMEGT